MTKESIENENSISENYKNNNTILLNLNKSNAKISSSTDSYNTLKFLEQNTQKKDLTPNGSLLTMNNELIEIENDKNKNNDNSLLTNQSTTIRIRPIKIVKKLPPQKTKIPTSRQKSRPVNIPFNVPIKKSDRVEDLVLWKNKIKQQPLARAIQGSHKILTTKDWEVYLYK